MCGIIGIASIRGVEKRDWLIAGRDAMTHRGPDDKGVWWSEDLRVGLGHRRLSIIDLSEAGHQPMLSSDNTTCIAFNGEIYNFRELRSELTGKGYVFRSDSDTEVILKAYRHWGTACLDHFIGMFAFAIYDQGKKTLFMARDRAGEKPLFYHHTGGIIQFASELKGLLADPRLERRINKEALDCYLTMGYIPGDRCILQGFNKLQPAHALEFNLLTGKTKKWQYWNLPEEPHEDAAFNENDLLKELEQLLENSVRRQMVADVPVGVLLSGGVDSSLVTAMASRSSAIVKTFTVRFPGYGAYDETEHARLIARHFGTEHIELDVEMATAELLPALAKQFDEPMADSSMIPTFLVSKLVREHCTVALGGDGGDELFGGYGYYSRLLWLHKYLAFLPHPIRKTAAAFATKAMPAGSRSRKWLQFLAVNLNESLPLLVCHYDQDYRNRLLGEYRSVATEAEEVVRNRTPKATGLLQRATRMDFRNYLPEDILVKVDRSSMLNSLEVRAPLLDHRLIEFSFGKVPACLRADAKSRKRLLKRLCTKLLPPEFDLKRKQGFSIPLADWFKSGPFRDMLNETLTDPGSMFDSVAVAELLRDQDAGYVNSERLFSLLMFELWRKEYEIKL